MGLLGSGAKLPRSCKLLLKLILVRKKYGCQAKNLQMEAFSGRGNSVSRALVLNFCS